MSNENRKTNSIEDLKDDICSFLFALWFLEGVGMLMQDCSCLMMPPVSEFIHTKW